MIIVRNNLQPVKIHLCASSIQCINVRLICSARDDRLAVDVCEKICFREQNLSLTSSKIGEKCWQIKRFKKIERKRPSPSLALVIKFKVMERNVKILKRHRPTKPNDLIDTNAKRLNRNQYRNLYASKSSRWGGDGQCAEGECWSRIQRR